MTVVVRVVDGRGGLAALASCSAIVQDFQTTERRWC